MAYSQTATLAPTTCTLFLKGEETTKYGDFRDDLIRDGFAVIKGAIPRERADNYADQMYKFLEDLFVSTLSCTTPNILGLGFKREDPSTVHWKNMPIINEKGMCHGYGLPHETFSWAIRSEPGVVGAFEKVYKTEDLVVSFDGLNFAFPNRTDLKANSPWPHQDQDPEEPDFRCLQGLVNLLPNGPSDGGLIVCKGAHQASEEFHKLFKDEQDKIWAWTKEWYGYTKAGMAWLESKGFQWEKVCAEPGDLIVWDSRTPHYNLPPTGSTPRFCAYTCYLPVAEVSKEDLLRKKGAFEGIIPTLNNLLLLRETDTRVPVDCQSTTHWPNAVQEVVLPILRDGVEDHLNYRIPKSGRPQLSERAYKLTGIPYIETKA
ncbi:hypothetical protein E4T38_07552 [Aureobasidium subglaciale]|nr:hypothetical protein E4T38_07552 [Aureobasidium subglaciale]KAI5217146.1 hypothetical protein E4T40_07535 [Aureobasidium subglaciale]KAI5220517.1 hypothetical protein E4T41_07478 [Aureobasidium subglaciale]KAI5258341.1 hypothetical protein E4T46_07455 [Aureobasidium subglaciale]